jgi:MFS transporter, ACDE family, multidrug resistance protein
MNWMVGTIVVPSDGSEAAEVQLASARALARATGARIVVAHVTRPDCAGRGEHSLRACADLEGCLREQVGALRNAGVRAELEILPSDGDLARVIAAAARKRDADLIVTRQSRGDALPGEVSRDLARRLMRLAPCPVLVVPRAA